MVLEPLTGRNTTGRGHRPGARGPGPRASAQDSPVDRVGPAGGNAGCNRLSRPRERLKGHLGPAFRLPAVTVHELDGCGYPARRQPAFVGIHERPEHPGGGKPGRAVRKGVAGPEAPQVAKERGDVGPSDADSLRIHDHIRESRLYHRVADVVHINKINNMRTVVDPFPASSKLREGARPKGRERDESPGTKHPPDLPEERPGIGKPEKAEIGSHEVGGFGGEGKREGTRRDGLDRAGATRFGQSRNVPAGKDPRSGKRSDRRPANSHCIARSTTQRGSRRTGSRWSNNLSPVSAHSLSAAAGSPRRRATRDRARAARRRTSVRLGWPSFTEWSAPRMTPSRGGRSGGRRHGAGPFGGPESRREAGEGGASRTPGKRRGADAARTTNSRPCPGWCGGGSSRGAAASAARSVRTRIPAPIACARSMRFSMAPPARAARRRSW